MIQVVDEGPVFAHGGLRDACLAAEERETRAYELLGEHERDGGVLGTHARATQLHPYPDVRLDEAQDSVEIPREHVDVIDGGGEDEDAIQLSHAVRGKVDLDAVEEGVFQVRLRVHLNVEDVTCVGKTMRWRYGGWGEGEGLR